MAARFAMPPMTSSGADEERAEAGQDHHDGEHPLLWPGGAIATYVCQWFTF